MGDRSIAVAAYPNTTAQPSHPFIAAPSGPNYLQPAAGLQAVPGLSTNVHIPPDGNGEVAVIFSAEVVLPVVPKLSSRSTACSSSSRSPS